MNTPAHIIFSLGLLGRRNASLYAIAIAFGALLPDLPMIFFYGYEKIRGIAQQQIWNEDYFLPAWQNFFDLFNSLPLLIVAALLSWGFSKKAWSMLFLSSVIHCLLDFLVHHDDGHRHFYPFTDFRFISPVSYWDPQHYGNIMSVLEIVLFLGGAVFLCFREARLEGIRSGLTPLRWTLILTTIIYCGFIFFVLSAWAAL